MNFEHKELAAGRWKNLTFLEQMANIGSEVDRAINWKNKNNLCYSEKAFFRALELIDLSLDCEKKYTRLRELARVREALVDYFYYNNQYGSSDKTWHNYFFAFTHAARAGK